MELNKELNFLIKKNLNTNARTSHCSGGGTSYCEPSKHKTLTQAGPMLAHRLQRWPSIKPVLVQRLVFAGKVVLACDRGVWAVTNTGPVIVLWKRQRTAQKIDTFMRCCFSVISVCNVGPVLIQHWTKFRAHRGGGVVIRTYTSMYHFKSCSQIFL